MLKLRSGLRFTIPFETARKDTPDVSAYLFDASGNLLEQQPVQKEKAAFATTPPDGYRVLIAPPPPPNSTEPLTYDALLKRDAFEPVSPGKIRGSFTLEPIPDRFIPLWPWRLCRVRGSVVKYFDIDHVATEKPVCRARVHICEVDKIRIVLPTIPDWVIDKLRDVIINPPRLFPKFPVPPVPPVLQVDPRLPRVDRSVISTRVNLPVSPLKFNAAENIVTKRKAAGAKSRIRKQVLKPVAELQQALPDDLKAQLISPSISAVRATLIENIEKLHPYFCGLPWIWPWFYSCTELAVAYTDGSGKFDTQIIYNPSTDIPDLYFWVEYEFNGVWSTVYKPSIPCHTYWDYACGTSVKITVSDPRVPMCGGSVIPGEIAWVRSVGTGASVTHIQQQMTATDMIQGHTFNTVGLTDYARTNGEYRRPFAKTLAFYVQFGSGFPSAGVSHFRWQYRRIKDAYLGDVAEAWQTVNSALAKPYTVEYTDVSGTHFKTLSWPLGPEPGLADTAFRIPPASPVAVTGDATAQWDQNTLSMAIASENLDDGLYEFRLQLLTVGGAVVTPLNVPKNTFQTPLYPDSTASENAPDTLLENSSATEASAFLVRLRIDNAPCEADIFNIKVYNPDATENESTTECGFVKYKDKAGSLVEFRIRAAHPRDFAEFYFDVARGNSGDALADADGSGMVIGDTAGGYVLGIDEVFRKKVGVAYLLKTCDKAAFAESLYVDALATDGSYLINEYDRSDLAAFALDL
ncbi:MAG: hypothetical protein INR69_01445 [Mucilaginibacter polytrichastri]|nr:hypothetical protein [Mucilaginibacter polytrichastri]